MSQVHEMFVRLYRIRKTILELLHDRNYLVSEQERNRTKEEFRVRTTGTVSPCCFCACISFTMCKGWQV